MSAFDTQVGGSHYKDLGVEPLKLTLLNKGYEAFSGACYCKINKYTSRIKDDEVEQLKKARHVLDMWIEEAENQKAKERLDSITFPVGPDKHTWGEPVHLTFSQDLSGPDIQIN